MNTFTFILSYAIIIKIYIVYLDKLYKFVVKTFSFELIYCFKM
jgi:hypothetical protein